MSAAFLCVQFRNLLPSEELLLFARALWADLQLRSELGQLGDATLAITQNTCDHRPFEVELSIAGTPLRSATRSVNPLLAVETVFSQLSAFGSLDGDASGLTETPLLGESATLSRACELA